MPDIGPDIEELFRRASKDYPLKQSEDKWSEIASKINGQSITQPATKQKSGYKKYFSILLFLLLFLSLDLFFSLPVPNQPSGIIKLKEAETQINQVTKTNDDIEGKISENSNNVTISPVDKNNFNRLQDPIRNTNIQHPLISGKASTQNKKTKIVQSIRQTNSFLNDFKENRNLDESATQNKKSVNIESTEANEKSLSNTILTDTGSRAEKIIYAQSNSIKKKAPNKILMHRFYYGLILGTELNSIENQDMKKAGFNIGLIGGYRFTKHISLETGVLFSQKYYTTAGEYFSLKEIGPMMPAAMKVMDVKGASMLVEIPLHVRYDFSAKKDHHFFTSAGISSYILTKESNRYHTSLNGTEAMMYATYKKNRGYFAASLDLAVGYEKNIGKKSSIRIQPYIQVPIKGIGVGSLKVISPGVHIAITQSAQ